LDTVRDRSPGVRLPLLGALLLLLPVSLEALQVPDRLHGRLIERVAFEGREEVSEEILRRNLATRQTRCRGLLLRPFCWLGDWEVITERHHLDRDELPSDELRLLVLYFRQGFRQTDVSTDVRESNGRVEVRFRIDEGPPTLLQRMDVHQVPEVLTARDLERAPFPREGRPFNLALLDQAMDFLEERLREAGYLDAAVTDSIEVEEREARVRLTIDPGPRSTIRRVDIEGNQEVDDATIRRGLLLEEGDVLTLPLVRRTRRTLYDTNLFHEVEVSVGGEAEEAGETGGAGSAGGAGPAEPGDSAKVVRIRLREAPPRLARVGGGLNTLEFGQVEGRFTHYNWLGGGRRLDLRATTGNLLAPQLNDRGIFRNVLPGDLAAVDPGPFEQPTWQATAELAQPHFRGARNTVGLSLFAHRAIIPGISIDQGFGGEVSLTRRVAFRAPLTLSYRHEVVRAEAGEVYFCVHFGVCAPPVIQGLRGRRSLSPVSLDFHVDRSDHALAPTAGYRIRVGVEHASDLTLSDFAYHRASGEASYYRSFVRWPEHVVAGRFRAGWVGALDPADEELRVDETGLSLIHPRKRFFAGGARSVRGFQENRLGPRVLTVPRDVLLEEDRCTSEEIAQGTCDPNLAPVDAFFPRPLGGSSLLEGSVEYRFPIGTVTAALFLDGAVVGGRVGGLVQDAAARVTPGFGVRFASPAGPIRIDLGIQGRPTAELPVVTETETEVTNGVIQRELVRLETLRRYDPLEDRGFVGRMLGRLTLHFSIGEAF
jgi:outer membrane protein assembly factor BamA